MIPDREKVALDTPPETVPEVAVPIVVLPLLMVKVTVPALTVLGATVAESATEASPYVAVAFEAVVVVVASAPIVSVPLPVEKSLAAAALAAWTVNAVEPAGVAAVVVTVKVEVFEVSPAAKLTVLGLNDAVAPDGNALVRLRFAVNAVPVAPLRFTVTV